MNTERSASGINYTLRRRRGQRNLHLRIGASGSVIVSAPYFVPFAEIDSFVLKSASWIAEKTEKTGLRSYESGDFVPYLGKKLLLIVKYGKISHYEIDDEKITVTCVNRDTETVKKIIKQLYTETVKDILTDRVPYWCKTLNLNVPTFGVNRAKSKWGVCYPEEKRLYLSYICASIPKDLIDMTVLHEVCHLRYPCHGKEFWNLMKSLMSDLYERKARLKELSMAGWTINLV